MSYAPSAISGIAVAAKALKPGIEIIGVQAALYPSMYNAIHDGNLPARTSPLCNWCEFKPVCPAHVGVSDPVGSGGR